MADPIQQMNELKAQNQQSVSTTLNLVSKNQLKNTNNEILVKQDQLAKIKNDRLNKKLEDLNELEHNIINKDRLIEQTNQVNQNNDKNIYTLYFGFGLSIILFIVILLYSLGKLNDKIAIVLISLIFVIFMFIILYTYNIAHFATLINFFENRRALRIDASIGQFGSRIKTWAQERVYGNKQDWVDNNCACPASEGNYTEEENTSVEIKPGYFYYDKNAPKQNLSPDGGEQINVSVDVTKPIYDKINWVNHDNVSNNIDNNNYSIEPNNNDMYKDGKLVGDSTYTINL